jgi:hypothetical protein
MGGGATFVRLFSAGYTRSKVRISNQGTRRMGKHAPTTITPTGSDSLFLPILDFSALNVPGGAFFQGHVIYSCVVQGTPRFIHAPDLPQTDPAFYRDLKAYAAARNVALMADRRSRQTVTTHERRRAWLPMLLLTFSIHTGVARATEPSASLAVAVQSTSLQLVVEQRQPGVSPPAQWSPAESSGRLVLSGNTTPERDRIETILNRHYEKSESDPPGIGNDLAELAGYFSRYPEVVKLIDSLADGNWSLRYRPGAFVTMIKGTPLGVESATIYFDPRAGARLKFNDACADKAPFCIASPADSLLHEMLHAQSALHDPEEFIAHGGMSGLLYPFQHERKTIARENRLYKSMTAIDNHPRPLRNEHTGRHVAVTCVTCIE